jgi:hypothetical protein
LPRPLSFIISFLPTSDFGFSQALRARRLRTALLAAPERTDQRLRGVEDAARAYASGTVTRRTH